MTVNLAPAPVSPLKPSSESVFALKEVFHTLDVDSCPGSYNFHLHTVYSDGKLQPEGLMEQAIAIGIKGLAITDHHSTRGYHKALLWLEHWKLDHPEGSATAPTLWSGVEISAYLLNVEVHILGYGFTPEHPCLQPYLQGKGAKGEDYQAVNVIDALHAAGGLAVLAHPCRYRHSAEQLIPEAVRLGIDGVETYYAYANPNPWHPSSPQTQQVRELSHTYGLLNTCGTDTHGLNILMRM